MQTFRINHDIVSLTVATNGPVVTRIELHGTEGGNPKGLFQKSVYRELIQYLEGSRRDFSFELRPEGTDFQKSVWQELSRIKYGQTVTYGEIANNIGKPGASRAVGMANNKNPIPIAIPCHRVVASGGKLGGFGGGVELKKKLLDLETVASLGEE